MTEREGSDREVVGWKQRLIDGYVSSGQAGGVSMDPEELVRRQLPWLNRLIDDFLPANRNARIIDLGCGYGALLYALRRRGYGNLEGVDASTEQIEAARKLGVEEVIQGEACDHLRDLPDASHDAIVAIDLLEHLGRGGALALAQESRRVLVSGGSFVVHVPNAVGPFGPAVRWSDLTHEIAFTPDSIQQLLRTAGFSSLEVHPDPPVVHGLASFLRRLVWTGGTWPLRLVNAAETGRLSAILTRNLFAVARL